jgi:DNA mismatch endonuclease (patch repair protein)
VADLMTPAQRSRCMSRIRSRDTKPELILRRLLFSRGLRFRTTLRVPGKPDIVFTAAKLAVFVDGCFWHGCPEHGTRPKTNRTYWDAKLERNRARDREVTAALEAAGWRVLRFWDHQVRQDAQGVTTDIETAWRTLRGRRIADAGKSSSPAPCKM